MPSSLAIGAQREPAAPDGAELAAGGGHDLGADIGDAPAARAPAIGRRVAGVRGHGDSLPDYCSEM